MGGCECKTWHKRNLDFLKSFIKQKGWNCFSFSPQYDLKKLDFKYIIVITYVESM